MNDKAYEIISRMTDAEWEALLLRLGRYAISASQHLDWRTKSRRDLPDGETVKSIVSKALKKLLTGERRWDPATNPSLEKYLMDVIDSLLNHLAESDDNKKLQAIPDRADGTHTEIQSSQPEASAEWLMNPCHTPEELLLKQEKDCENEEALEMLIDECEDKPVLRKVLQAMFDGCETPRSIAERTGLTAPEIYNASKQLDRKVAAVRKKITVGKSVSVARGKRNV